MKIPRDLSGQALIRHLSRAWGYRVVNRAGSHVTLETQLSHSYLRLLRRRRSGKTSSCGRAELHHGLLEILEEIGPCHALVVGHRSRI
jgi:hypothetical protein